jgi:hypothetical protein
MEMEAITEDMDEDEEGNGKNHARQGSSYRNAAGRYQDADDTGAENCDDMPIRDPDALGRFFRNGPVWTP